MNICFVPSLQHLSCVKIVTILINKPEISSLQKLQKEDYDRIQSQVTQRISNLIRCPQLQWKLQSFIAPLFGVFGQSLKFFGENLLASNNILEVLLEIIPQCWRTDGTIDLEKSVKTFANGNTWAVDRFIIACRFCLLEEVIAVWNVLPRIEKAYLQHTHQKVASRDELVIFWIQWLEGESNKDWESFIAGISTTPFWKNNVYVLKRVLETISPEEKSEFLLNALTGDEVSLGMIRFGFPIMSNEQRELVVRASPVTVLRCFFSWPQRRHFLAVVDIALPHLSSGNFCIILCAMLDHVQKDENDYLDFVEFLKKLWEDSSDTLKNAAKEKDGIFRPLQFILEHDSARTFDRQGYLQIFSDIRADMCRRMTAAAAEQHAAERMRYGRINFRERLNLP